MLWFVFFGYGVSVGFIGGWCIGVVDGLGLWFVERVVVVDVVGGESVGYYLLYDCGWGVW